MSTLAAVLLVVNLSAGSYSVPALPDQQECDRLGKLQLVGRKGATYQCVPYTMIAPASGPSQSTSGDVLLAK